MQRDRNGRSVIDSAVKVQTHLQLVQQLLVVGQPVLPFSDGTICSLALQISTIPAVHSAAILPFLQILLGLGIIPRLHRLRFAAEAAEAGAVPEAAAAGNCQRGLIYPLYTMGIGSRGRKCSGQQ